MCGIVGFTGRRSAAPILLKGLRGLEYRGYDSAGIAVTADEKKGKNFTVVKAEGRLNALVEKTKTIKTLNGSCGIGHTRWATHGAPSVENAHPHSSDDGFVVGVHNGVIENFAAIKERLQKAGYSFYSQTDTEAAIKLIDYYAKKQSNDPIFALSRFIENVKGSYAIAVMFASRPNEIFAVRKDSPLVVGTAKGEGYIASDVAPLLLYTRRVHYVREGEIVWLKGEQARFFNKDGEETQNPPVTVQWEAQAAQKNGYKHFMLKEICEQPQAVKNTLRYAVTDGECNLAKMGVTELCASAIEEVCVIGCGSAYHVGVAAQYILEKLARIPTRVEIASEFRYQNRPIGNNTLAIFISQSGETADTLAALRHVKERGIKTLAIVNVVGSSIAREADGVFYTQAGPEIAVATTKAYSTQLVAIYLLSMHFARARGNVTATEFSRLLKEVNALPDKIEKILQGKARLQRLAKKFCNRPSVFFIGRGLDYAVGLEGCLKLKEISYIHAQAYPAGELKHGSISLIEEGTPVLALATQTELLEKNLSNLSEVKSRGGTLTAVTPFDKELSTAADDIIQIPKTEDIFAPSLAVIPLQLISYYVSDAMGLDVDKPRNLAKSVTVE